MYRDPYTKSLFIIDGFQQRCHMTWLIFLFLTLGNIWFGAFLSKNNVLQSYEKEPQNSGKCL